MPEALKGSHFNSRFNSESNSASQSRRKSKSNHSSQYDIEAPSLMTIPEIAIDKSTISSKICTLNKQILCTSKKKLDVETSFCDVTVGRKDEKGTDIDDKVDGESRVSPIRKDGRKLIDRHGFCEITLLVTDQSAAISNEDIKGLLLPYSQIRPDHLEQGRSTGLWLVLAKEIINLHDGDVIITSEIGFGNTFGFKIPFEFATSTEERTSDSLRPVEPPGSCILETQETQNSNPDFIPSSAEFLSPPTSTSGSSEGNYLVVDGE